MKYKHISDQMLLHFIQGRLPKDDQNIVEEHIFYCPHCAKKLGNMRFEHYLHISYSHYLDKKPPIKEKIIANWQTITSALMVTVRQFLWSLIVFIKNRPAFKLAALLCVFFAVAIAAPFIRDYFIPENYALKTIGQDKIVIANKTNLIWQYSGSPVPIKYEAIDVYIDSLNVKRYAGFTNWRLPTVNEARSLKEEETKNGDLYINPVFDNTQRVIWTSERAEQQPYVYRFDYVAGGPLYSPIERKDIYIRAVCAQQSFAK